MVLSALVVAAALSPASQETPVNLQRVFTKGEKLEYQVSSKLHVERRQRGLLEFIPEEFDLLYKFSIHVTDIKADGFAELAYKRPTMTQIQGETFDSPPKTTVEKVNLDLILTVSPLNELVASKEVPKKTPPKKNGKANFNLGGGGASALQVPFLDQFVSEVYRLSLFAGSLDSTLDFAPRFHFDKVKVGDTWKRTVGYSPQKLKGKDGKSAVQRLDYVYTYRGPKTVNNKQFLLVTATLDLDTDLASFVNQMFEATPEQTGLKSAPLKLKANVDFLLDPKTKRTLNASARTEGGYKLMITQMPEDPLREEKLKGETTLRLLSSSTVPVKAK